jgi:LAO/AO transport system kinase
VQANKAGLMEIADIFVINKSDRSGSAETRRDLEQMLDLSDLAHDAWRPPIISAVGTTGKGVPELWAAVLEHRASITGSGVLTERREFRLREELRDIVARRLEHKARAICGGDRWEAIQADVLHRRLDPWGAADQMLSGIDA